MKGTATDPLLLSESEDVQERFREMVRETLSSVFRSFSDGSAFSGIDPYELREKVKRPSRPCSARSPTGARSPGSTRTS